MAWKIVIGANGVNGVQMLEFDQFIEQYNKKMTSNLNIIDS